MAVHVNGRAFNHAKALVREKQFVADDRDSLSEHQPSAEEEDRYRKEHGFSAYGLWYLGVDHEHAEDTKARYRFRCGDCEKVHRCGLLAAESRAGQRKYHDIELAVAHLHGMLDAPSANARRP